MNYLLICILTLGFNIFSMDNPVLANIKQKTENGVPKLKFYSQVLENIENNQRDNSQQKLTELFNPPGDGAPTDTTAGGSRDGGNCRPDESSIIALMPKENYGLTSKESPRIYLHLPQSSAKEVLISLQDETGSFYQAMVAPIQTNSNSNIASFTLPDTTIPLEIGKRYQWFVTVVCDRYVQPGDPTFSGWIKRVESTPESDLQVNNKNPEQQAQWYAKHSYWYDMLDSIPENSNLWQDIIEQVSNQ